MSSWLRNPPKIVRVWFPKTANRTWSASWNTRLTLWINEDKNAQSFNIVSFGKKITWARNSADRKTNAGLETGFQSWSKTEKSNTMCSVSSSTSSFCSRSFDVLYLESSKYSRYFWKMTQHECRFRIQLVRVGIWGRSCSNNRAFATIFHYRVE